MVPHKEAGKIGPLDIAVPNHGVGSQDDCSSWPWVGTVPKVQARQMEVGGTGPIEGPYFCADFQSLGRWFFII